MYHFTKDQFDVQADGALVAEASELGIPPEECTGFKWCGPEGTFKIDGTWYVLSKIDRDASHEDIMGWRFLNPATGTRVLIIND